jgi:hypothetical protein
LKSVAGAILHLRQNEPMTVHSNFGHQQGQTPSDALRHIDRLNFSHKVPQESRRRGARQGWARGTHVPCPPSITGSSVQCFPKFGSYRSLRCCAPSPALRGGGLGWGKLRAKIHRSGIAATRNQHRRCRAPTPPSPAKSGRGSERPMPVA